MIAGYFERQDRLWDILGRHALSTAEYPKGTTLSQVLGRDPFPRPPVRDPRKPKNDDDIAPHGTDEEWTEWDKEEVELERTDQQKKGGLPTGRMTPEELEEAYRQVRS